MYRHLFVALIDAAWRNAAGDQEVPAHTFNVALPPGYTTSRKKLQLGDQIIDDIVFEIGNGKPLSLFLSTTSSELCMALLALQKDQPIVVENGFCFIHRGGHRLSEQTITTNRAFFKICSPVCLSDIAGDPTIDGEEADLWSAAIARVQEQVALAATGHGFAGEIRVTPLDVKRKVVKHAIGKLKEQRNGFGYVSSFTGTIAIDGLPEDLNTIYITGLGTRTAEGFGMLDLMAQPSLKE